MEHQKVTYSLPNLKVLVSSPNSCVNCIEKCQRSLTVLPVHLDNIKVSVNQLLQAKVTTYDTLLKGIILGHKNTKVVNHVQLNDDGNFELDYVADVYIFMPEVGSLLSGEVNKKSKDHISVLVHSFFNASIPRPRNDAGCPRNWIGFDASIGQSVTFEVVKVNLSGRLPFIKGKLVDVGDNDNEDKDSGIGGHESMEENGAMRGKIERSMELNGEIVKKKKKKKKHKLPETLEYECEEDKQLEVSVDKPEEELRTEDSLVNGGDEELTDCYSEKKKKKKRKKHQKHPDSECLETEPTPFNTQSECFVETIKKEKKSKKRKLYELDEFSTPEPNCSNTNEMVVQIPKKKKKKKHSDFNYQCQE